MAPNPSDDPYKPSSFLQYHRESYEGSQVHVGRRKISQVDVNADNLVRDFPAPSRLNNPARSKDEFSKMRYTAATCDPDDFMSSQYSLRQSTWGRQTELFIVMTMYDEDEEFFVKTMTAVRKNIAYLCDTAPPDRWGPEGWKKIVVCIVSDGRNEVNKRTLQVLNLMGCYQEGVMQNSVGGKDVTAHIFEYTSTAIVTASGEVSDARFPVQILFCLKQQNKKKLNSHRWFFNAFAPLLKPSICILLDVGTIPIDKSIYELWRCFDRQKNVGGACGEIFVDPGRYSSLVLKSPLAASQNFEYKISNILDKPFESVFGFISVLPGAFSAYRYEAIQNVDGEGPLASYFKGENMHAGLLDRNMYLAEDRILGFEVVTKKREGWVLKYVKSAKASTDVPANVPDFISQRRRWLNGGLFASIHATVFFYRIWTSGQSFPRKISLQVEFIYNAIRLLFTWTALANFYLAFFFLVGSARRDSTANVFNFLGHGAGKDVFDVVLSVYIGVLFLVLVCSLGNRPQGYKGAYISAIFLFGLCNLIMIWCAGYTIYVTVAHNVAGWRDFSELSKNNQRFRELVISFLATFGLYFVNFMMYWEPWHMFTSGMQYLFFLPSYINILMMYALCNLDDVSWGTKGDNGAAMDMGGDEKAHWQANGNESVAPTTREGVDQLWDASQKALGNKFPKEKERRSATTKQMDRDRNIRTNVVLAWAGFNMLVIIVFTSNSFANWATAHHIRGNTPFNPYLSFLIYAFSGLSAVRFTGSFLYLCLRLFEF